MKKAIRLITLLIALAMVFTVLAGCGSDSKTKESGKTQTETTSTGNSGSTGNNAVETGVTDVEDPYGLPNNMSNYPLKDKVTLTYWVPIEGWAAPAIKSYNDSEIYKEIEKITNVSIEWIHPAVGQAAEQFNLMMASDDLPDIIQPAGFYKGGVSAGIKDGVYINLKDTIEKYAPNYKKFRESDNERRKTTVDDEGNIGAFFCLSPYEEWTWWGPMIKKAWLDELNIAMPETMNDWYNMLKAFKDKKGAKFPFLPGGNYGTDWCGVFVSAYDAYDWLFYKDGKVQFGPIQPGMKDYLTEMRKWYAEGLIDKDFATRDWNSWQSTLISNDSGAFLQSPDTAYGILQPQNIEFVAAPYPVMNKGETIHYRWKHFKNGGQEAAITTSCKNVEVAAKFLDFGYTRKGWQLYNYGIPERAHKLDDKKIPYLWDGSIIYNDPDKIPAVNALWKYKMHWGPFIRDEHNANPIIVQSKVSGEMRKFWTDTIDGAYALPPVTFSPQESQKEASIATQIATLRTEVFTKIIMGKEPVEKWDEFVAQCKKVGLDEMLSLWNTAAERYNNRN